MSQATTPPIVDAPQPVGGDVIPPKGHPKGLYLLYVTEMAERFSYYGMRAIFTLYMINALVFDKATASQVYGSYTGLVYLTPLLGGYIADRYWGNRRSIIFGGLLMAIGQFFMFMSGSLFEDVGTATMLMYTGLGFLIFGNGFFKPNISTMVGQLYREGDQRVDSAFTIFYQGINMGALLAPIICGGLGEVYDKSGANVPTQFKWGFLAACIGMVLSLVAFIARKNKLLKTPDGAPVGLPPSKSPLREAERDKAVEPKGGGGISTGKLLIGLVALGGLYALFNLVLGFDVIGAVIFSACLVLPALIISEPSLTKMEKDRILVIYIIAFFVIFFWSAFEQAGASLTFFAQEQTNRKIFGWTMPASYFQSFNALFIVLLAPVAVAVWNSMARRGKEPSSPVKQSLGLLFLALGYLYIAWGVRGVQPYEKVSMIWLVGLYLIHTIGELCLSPIGLSMVVKLAPARFVSLLMGVWFMSTATANKFAGELSALYPEEVKVARGYGDKTNPGVFASMAGVPVDTATFNKAPLNESTALPTAAVQTVKRGTTDSVVSVTPAGGQVPVSNYFLKLITLNNPKFNRAAVSADGRYLYTTRMEDVVVNKQKAKEERFEVYDLKPERPRFAGMQITNLFDFFMIFVYMAGAAALILFLIHKWLLKRMHGVR